MLIPKMLVYVLRWEELNLGGELELKEETININPCSSERFSDEQQAAINLFRGPSE